MSFSSGFVRADLAIGAVMQSIDKGLAVARAQRLLEREAADPLQDAGIAKHLLKIAAAIPSHATPAAMLRSHERNYNDFFNKGAKAWGSVSAVQIARAAETFGRAAAELE